MILYSIIKLDIRNPQSSHQSLKDAANISLVHICTDRRTAEDEMMWRIQNDFYDLWTDILSDSDSHADAEEYFGQWIERHFVNDNEWVYSDENRLYKLKIVEAAL